MPPKHPLRHEAICTNAKEAYTQKDGKVIPNCPVIKCKLKLGNNMCGKAYKTVNFAELLAHMKAAVASGGHGKTEADLTALIEEYKNQAQIQAVDVDAEDNDNDNNNNNGNNNNNNNNHEPVGFFGCFQMTDLDFAMAYFARHAFRNVTQPWFRNLFKRVELNGNIIKGGDSVIVDRRTIPQHLHDYARRSLIYLLKIAKNRSCVLIWDSGTVWGRRFFPVFAHIPGFEPIFLCLNPDSAFLDGHHTGGAVNHLAALIDEILASYNIRVSGVIADGAANMQTRAQVDEDGAVVAPEQLRRGGNAFAQYQQDDFDEEEKKARTNDKSRLPFDFSGIQQGHLYKTREGGTSPNPRVLLKGICVCHLFGLIAKSYTEKEVRIAAVKKDVQQHMITNGISLCGGVETRWNDDYLLLKQWRKHVESKAILASRTLKHEVDGIIAQLELFAHGTYLAETNGSTAFSTIRIVELLLERARDNEERDSQNFRDSILLRNREDKNFTPLPDINRWIKFCNPWVILTCTLCPYTLFAVRATSTVVNTFNLMDVTGGLLATMYGEDVKEQYINFVIDAPRVIDAGQRQSKRDFTLQECEAWWLQVVSNADARTMFGRLSTVARDVFRTIQSEAQAERYFSALKEILTPQRLQLRDSVVEASSLVNHNSKLVETLNGHLLKNRHFVGEAEKTLYGDFMRSPRVKASTVRSILLLQSLTTHNEHEKDHPENQVNAVQIFLDPDLKIGLFKDSLGHPITYHKNWDHHFGCIKIPKAVVPDDEKQDDDDEDDDDDTVNDDDDEMNNNNNMLINNDNVNGKNKNKNNKMLRRAGAENNNRKLTQKHRRQRMIACGHRANLKCGCGDLMVVHDDEDEQKEDLFIYCLDEEDGGCGLPWHFNCAELDRSIFTSLDDVKNKTMQGEFMWMCCKCTEEMGVVEASRKKKLAKLKIDHNKPRA